MSNDRLANKTCVVGTQCLYNNTNIVSSCRMPNDAGVSIIIIVVFFFSYRSSFHFFSPPFRLGSRSRRKTYRFRGAGRRVDDIRKSRTNTACRYQYDSTRIINILHFFYVPRIARSESIKKKKKIVSPRLSIRTQGGESSDLRYRFSDSFT